MNALALCLAGALLLVLEPFAAPAVTAAAAPPEVFVGGGSITSHPADGCPPVNVHVVLRQLPDRPNALAVISALPAFAPQSPVECGLARAAQFSPAGYATPGGGHVRLGPLLLAGSWQAGWVYQDSETTWRLGPYGSGCGIQLQVVAGGTTLRGATADLARCGGPGIQVPSSPEP